MYFHIYTQALLEEVKAHKPPLTQAVVSGRALEAYVQEKGATGVADIGYSRMEERYTKLEVNYHCESFAVCLGDNICVCTCT